MRYNYTQKQNILTISSAEEDAEQVEFSYFAIGDENM